MVRPRDPIEYVVHIKQRNTREPPGGCVAVTADRCRSRLEHAEEEEGQEGEEEIRGGQDSASQALACDGLQQAVGTLLLGRRC